MRMLELGMLPAGRSVFDTIGPETRRRLESKLAETGLPGEIVAGFRPWMIALTLATLEFQRLGFDPNLGVDMHFFNKATDRREADCRVGNGRVSAAAAGRDERRPRRPFSP